MATNLNTRPINCHLYQSDKTRYGNTLLVKLLKSSTDFEGGIFQEIPAKPFRHLVNWTTDPKDADYLFLPINYSQALTIQNYIKEFLNFAKKYNLKTVIINHGDYTKPVHVANGLVLKTSAYKSQLLSNEVVIPAFSEDLGEKYGHEPKNKNSEKPEIGFSGMIYLPSNFQECKYRLRLLKQWLLISAGQASRASYQGLYYRRKIYRILESSGVCNTKFNVRRSFSRSLKTIEKSPKEIRKEFVDSIMQSDLALVVRGDGNYSLRLFEVLSLGRVPLFIDTDSALPLEDVVDYDEFMLRVDYSEIDDLPNIIKRFWDRTSEDKFISMQEKARQAFETYLRTDKFYSHLFQNL